MLEAFGLDARTEDVYRAVLQRPRRRAEDVAAVTDRTEPDVGAALEALAALDLVHVDDGAWSAVPPERAVELLLLREEQRLEERRAELARSREAIPHLVEEFVAAGRTTPSDELELLPEPGLVRSRLFQLCRQAVRTTWAVHPGPPLTPEAIDAALPLDRDAAERGVACRMVVTEASLGPAHWQSYLEELVRMGHQVRVAVAATQLCIVVDGEHAVVPSSTDGRPPFGAYVLHGAALTRPVVALFEEIWARSRPLADATDPAEAGATVSEARMRELAQVLALGVKDDVAARRLGVSVRTLRRTTAAMLRELQADSRFQAGATAAARGWLGPG